MEEQPSNSENKQKKGFPTGGGLAVGIAIGVAMGAALHNIGFGIAIGVAMGIAFDGANLWRNKSRP